MKPCKHLDHNPERYPSCELIELKSFSCPVFFWKRPEAFTHENGERVNPENVQFCGKGRGRINEIFACYNEGEMYCYQPKEASAASQGASDER